MCTETFHSLQFNNYPIFFSNRKRNRTRKCDLKIKNFRGNFLTSISSSFGGASCFRVNKQTHYELQKVWKFVHMLSNDASRPFDG